MKPQSIDIILSVRIGDSILSLPALVCLNQLNKEFENNLKIKVLSRPAIQKLLSSLDLFSCTKMGLSEKIKSTVLPSDKAFFIEATTKNIGYKAKETFGLDNPHKKLLKFSQQMPYVRFENIKTILPKDLVSFLIDEKKLSYYSASLFGICLDLGYSTEQIVNTFEFSQNSINIKKFTKSKIKNLKENTYLIFCMEAGYGKLDQKQRHWHQDSYLDIAKRCFKDYNLKAVFIGVDTEKNLPNEYYIIDLRGKLNLFDLACLTKQSVGYIGNDTGPLHIANLMKKPSVSMYFKENLMIESSPIFPELNAQVYMPETINEVYNKVKELIKFSNIY